MNEVSELKFLGITLNKPLNFNTHFQKTYKKVLYGLRGLILSKNFQQVREILMQKRDKSLKKHSATSSSWLKLSRQCIISNSPVFTRTSQGQKDLLQPHDRPALNRSKPQTDLGTRHILRPTKVDRGQRCAESITSSARS